MSWRVFLCEGVDHHLCVAHLYPAVRSVMACTTTPIASNALTSLSCASSLYNLAFCSLCKAFAAFNIVSAAFLHYCLFVVRYRSLIACNNNFILRYNCRITYNFCRFFVLLYLIYSKLYQFFQQLYFYALRLRLRSLALTIRRLRLLVHLLRPLRLFPLLLQYYSLPK